MINFKCLIPRKNMNKCLTFEEYIQKQGLKKSVVSNGILPLPKGVLPSGNADKNVSLRSNLPSAKKLNINAKEFIPPYMIVPPSNKKESKPIAFVKASD